jgi:deoxyribonuclease-4
MLRIGAHMSIAGGVSKAVDRALAHGCEALQIFTKNASQWRAKPLDPAEVRAFRRRIDETGVRPAVSHASYLINLATAFPALREQSIAAFVDEIERADALGLLGVVIHPGACTSGTVEDGLGLIGDAIRQALEARPRRRTLVILEHTAGQGRTLGHRFEHLAAIIGHVRGSPRVGICLDTCHLIASGYDITSAEGYVKTFDEFGRTVGFDRLKMFHMNDSKKPLGSRVDRHAHIGEGTVGLEAFRRLVNDRRFRSLPMLLETPKSEARARGSIEVDPLDAKNLAVLRSLLQTPARP